MNYRIFRWGTLAVLAVSIGLGLGVFTSHVHAESAEKLAKESASKLYKQGQAAETKGDIELAFQLYCQSVPEKPQGPAVQDQL